MQQQQQERLASVNLRANLLSQHVWNNFPQNTLPMTTLLDDPLLTRVFFLNLRPDYVTILLDSPQRLLITPSSGSQSFAVPVSMRVGNGLRALTTVEPVGFVRTVMTYSLLCPDAKPWARQLAGTQ